MEFLTTEPRETIYSDFIDKIQEKHKCETIKVESSAGRVVCKDIKAPLNIPPFDRSTVDGIAVNHSDVIGATPSNPVYLTIKGTVKMGQRPNFSLNKGESAIILTGGWLPDGADCVVMLEHINLYDNQCEVLRAIGSGENVIFKGDDIKEGSILIKKGNVLNAATMGMLHYSGITDVPVSIRPVAFLISTGDEIENPYKKDIPEGHIRDANSIVISELLKKEGAVVINGGIIRDDETMLLKAIEKGIQNADIVIISGGSSKGSRDYTVSAINKAGEPGVIFHGVAVSPGKPTIFARVHNKVIIGLPGHPVSSFVSSFLFLLPLVRKITGSSKVYPKPLCKVKVAANIPSAEGKENWIRVKIKDGTAHPVFSDSGILSSLAFSDGFIRIDANSEGVKLGEHVEFYPYDAL